MAIAVIGMTDEREPALRLIKEGIERRGHETVLIDISIGTGAVASSLEPDITCEDLAKRGGTTAQGIRDMLAKERDRATEIMSRSLGQTLVQLKEEGRLKGVIAVGGMTGTTITLPAMKQLPFGFPKLLISSVAAMPAYAKRLAEFFGVRDITVMHSVVDTVGLNPLVHRLMINGAGAICGMVEEEVQPDLGGPGGPEPFRGVYRSGSRGVQRVYIGWEPGGRSRPPRCRVPHREALHPVALRV
ncbi:MAG: Tm-1-like ATP-binding domain-containing protein [Deltaproteobacteria bacterium]